LFLFVLEKTGSVQDHIQAILLQRLYRLRVDSKEKWAVLSAMFLFAGTSIVYLYNVKQYKADVMN